MKKIISAVLCTVIAILNISLAAFAENVEIEGLHEKLNALFIENNFTQEELKNMENNWEESFADFFWGYYLTSLKALCKMETESDEEEYEYWRNFNMPDFTKGVHINIRRTNKYMAQYAESNVLDYLFSGESYWVILGKNTNSVKSKNRNDGTYIEVSSNEFKGEHGGIIFTNEMYEFLRDEDSIRDILLEKNETKVDDIKILPIATSLVFLYIRCDNNEYLIQLQTSSIVGEGEDYIANIKKYNIYSAEYVLNELGRNFERVRAIKPIYNEEAEALQQAGLLQGNENGLDLLKPLTRAEAVTLLIRAIGLDDQTVNYPVSQFSDIASDNWASPYAALAKAEGITNGISETEFAPDDRVTAEQFATFTLRAAGENNFDYTQGIQILIDRGVITEEESETMDLFTRGDMAKIIYEAKEEGLL